MSPILVRPVREQLEHDRIIRLLQSKSRRKYDAGMNPGAEQNVPVVMGINALYPDLVLHSQERGRGLEVIVVGSVPGGTRWPRHGGTGAAGCCSA